MALALYNQIHSLAVGKIQPLTTEEKVPASLYDKMLAHLPWKRVFLT